jgi:hypothetical protein
VAVPEGAGEELTAATVEATRQAILDERYAEILGYAPLSP